MQMRRTLFLLFFVSGACGLLYQIVWLRLAFASFGVITPVLSVVIAIFMLGLALGSWVAGKWVGAWSR
jgi:spermidine synthase